MFVAVSGIAPTKSDLAIRKPETSCQFVTVYLWKRFQILCDLIDTTPSCGLHFRCCLIINGEDHQPSQKFKNRKHFRSDIDDYLANLRVGFEEARRFLDLFKRERARDDWLQLPRSEPAGNECFYTL